MSKLQLKILTQESVKVDEPVDMVIMRCVNATMGRRSVVGELGIMPGHMPLCAVLGISAMRIFSDDDERIIAIHGGVVEVRNNEVTILTEKAEWPEELELARAEASRLQAELDAAGLEYTAEVRKNQIELRRALVRIEVSSYPLVHRKK